MVGRFHPHRFWAVTLFAVALLGLGCNKPERLEEKSKEAAGQQGESVGKEGTQPPASPNPNQEAPGKLPQKVAGAAAEEAPAEEQQPDAVSLEPSEAELIMESLKKLKDQALTEAQWAQELRERLESLRNRLAEAEQVLKDPSYTVGVPSKLDPAVVEAEWRKAAVDAGTEVQFFEITEASVHRDAIPPMVPDRKPFQITMNDVRDIFLVVARIPRVDDATMERFVSNLAKLDRLTLPTRVQVFGDRVIVNAEVYRWREVPLPERIVRQKDLKEELRRAGVSLSVEEVVKMDPIGHLQHTALSFKTYNAARPHVVQALKAIDRLAVFELQRQLVESLKKKIADVDLGQLRHL